MDVGFWGKNGGWQVNLRGLGKPGEKKRSKTFENVQKYSKNDVKRSKIFEKLGEIFESIRRFRSIAAGALLSSRSPKLTQSFFRRGFVSYIVLRISYVVV